MHKNLHEYRMTVGSSSKSYLVTFHYVKEKGDVIVMLQDLNQH